MRCVVSIMLGVGPALGQTECVDRVKFEKKKKKAGLSIERWLSLARRPDPRKKAKIKAVSDPASRVR